MEFSFYASRAFFNFLSYMVFCLLYCSDSTHFQSLFLETTMYLETEQILLISRQNQSSSCLRLWYLNTRRGPTLSLAIAQPRSHNT